MLTSIIEKYEIILGSKSPRRKELLNHIFSEFSIQVKSVEETFPKELKNEEIAIFLSELKAKEFSPTENQLIITADTIVLIDGLVLGKPKDKNDAFKMLKMLSGKTHEVITACTIKTNKHFNSFYDKTEVTFYELSDEQIIEYIEKCRPLDKAGSYGIQDWMGHVGIRKMNGEFFNVMGLPLHKLYRELKRLE